MSTDSYFSYKVFVIYSGKTLAFTTAFFTALPTMIAITIFAASPGRYGITPAYNPCTNVKCICDVIASWNPAWALWCFL